MTSPHPPNDPIEALVSSHLEQQAGTVDAPAFLNQLQQRLTESGDSCPASGGLRPRLAGLRRWLLGLTAAAAVLMAFLGGHYLKPAQASPEAIVREACQVHALPIDRCYLVQWMPLPGANLPALPIRAQPRETRLWTRGDRFWMSSTNPERQWAWGRDEQGAVWLALGHKHGVRFERDEVPEPLAVACDINSLELETLLNEVLHSFRLVHLPAEMPDGTATYRIRAVPSSVRPLPGIGGALLEIDETRVVRRLILRRMRGGQPLARVTFTLVDTSIQPDAAYKLEGHLQPGAPVYTRDNHRPVRDRLMRNFFGFPPPPGPGQPAGPEPLPPRRT